MADTLLPDWPAPANVRALQTLRSGGVSQSPWHSLNLGDHVGDDPAHVAANRALLRQQLPGEPLWLQQVHGIVTVNAENSPIFSPADASFTRKAGQVCAVMTADCLPVLFCDRAGTVVAAAHAGWRGAHEGVLEATLDAMEALGARRDNIAAVIGPTISQAAYEVGPEFYETFTDDDPAMRRFFANGAGDRMLFDLPAYGLFRLRAAGVGHAEWTRHCTYADPARFYSYRRTTHAKEADYGRLISVIRL